MQVILGAAYRGFVHLAAVAGIETKECWQVDRGDDLPSVMSCEGLGDPSYFYINGVWLFAGVTAAVLFIYGCFLSHSFLGGIIAIASFFFNHGEVKFRIFLLLMNFSLMFLHLNFHSVHTSSMDASSS